jgi:uncharacterized protein (TIGR02099 family)
VNWRVVARIGLGLVLLAWSLLLAAWLTLHWGILPHLNDWRPQIQTRASQALGVPVRIGRIEVQSRGWVPALRLYDVALIDAQGQEALKLPQVAAAVSVRSLLALTLRFEQLLIDGARLEVRRDAQGRVFVAGLPVQGDGDGGDAAADWFFKQREFVIRHGSVRWTDEKLQAPPLELTDVDLVVRNGFKRHSIRLDATPPADWGRRFSVQGRFSQPLLADKGDWKRWTGTAHLDLPYADLSQLRHHLQLPFELSQGEGALRAWVDVERGELRGATLDVALNAVALTLGRDLQPLALQQVQGRLTARRDAKGLQFGAQNLAFLTGDHQAWPRGSFNVSLQQRQDVPGAPVTGGEFSADRLDLALMAGIGERLPLGDAVRRLLAELQPQGEVRALAARWDGPLDAPQHYQVKARLAGLSIAAGPVPAEPHAAGRPGFRNAQIELRANEGGGEATLAVDAGAMEFPGVFDDPVVPLDRFGAQLAWRIERPRPAPPGTPPALELKVRNARFANADAEGTLQATWRTGPGQGRGAGGRFPGLLDMTGQLSRGEAAKVARYLPLGIPAETRDYVARAVRGGRVDSAEFKVKGDLWQFPFAHVRDGEFRIAGHVSGVDYAYVPAQGDAPSPWPAFANVSADLVFDRSAMDIRRGEARVFGYQLSNIQGGIRNMAENATLQIEGRGRGPLGEALRYVNASPVGGWIGDGLKAAAAAGNSELQLALEIPLHDSARSTVKGSVALQGNDVRLRPDVPLLAQARGRVEFSHKGFALRNVTARALGGDAALEGGTLTDGSTRVTVQGMATADGLRRNAELPWLARMAQSFSGQAPYRVGVGVVKGRTELWVTSPLTGLALDLPAPLRKSAETPLPLRVQIQPDPSGGARDTLRLDLGNVVHASYQRDLSRDPPQALAGALSVLEPLPAPVPGVAARLNLGVFDADAWRQLTARWFGDDAGAGSATAGGYVPHQIALQAQELRMGGRRLNQVVATLSALPGGEPGWRAGVVAQQLAGEIEYRPGGAGRVQARLSRVALPRTEEASVESLLDQAPASLPALDIVVDDFELRGKRLGRLEVLAQNSGEAGQREWRLSRLNLGMPEAQFAGSGRWVPGGSRRMVLDFKLDIADAGGLLQRLGMAGALKGGKGKLQGQVAWQGSPFALDYPTLSGQLHLGLDKGQFLKAGAGAARLLGVLSLQSLPRRLALDFRDLFDEGFAFDNVSGDMQIREGVASTNNLRMRGVQAAVLMEGQAHLERETQDLRVIVVPEINAGTASLAYAAINPAIGLGTFVAQLFLRKPLMQAGTREFHITGSWDDPKVERVERKATDPLPDMEAAAPAASSPGPR